VRGLTRPEFRNIIVSMSVVEDVRQVLQDFLAPELRAISTRLDAIEQRIQDQSALMNVRFDAQTKDIAQVKELLEIDRRLTKLESKQAQVA
jgi:hypothetical protein